MSQPTEPPVVDNGMPLPVLLCLLTALLAAAVAVWAWLTGLPQLLLPLAGLCGLCLLAAGLLRSLHRLGQEQDSATDLDALLRHAEDLAARGEIDREAAERLRRRL